MKLYRIYWDQRHDPFTWLNMSQFIQVQLLYAGTSSNRWEETVLEIDQNLEAYYHVAESILLWTGGISEI